MLVLYLGGCKPAASDDFPYLLDQPLGGRELPATLREVSGMTVDARGRLHLVQDERGVRYVYDWAQDKVLGEERFGEDGDFEGLASAPADDGTMRHWAIRSDGLLYAAFAERPPYTEYVDVGHVADFEGLGYDAQRGVLWLAAKEAASPSAQQLYAIDPDGLRIKRSVTITLAALQRYCARNGAPCNWGKGKSFPLSPSGVAVHPFTGHIYIVAARERALCVVDDAGEVLYLGQFARKLLPQAEGIAFFANGDLVIASEGDSRGRLVRFAYRKLR